MQIIQKETSTSKDKGSNSDTNKSAEPLTLAELILKYEAKTAPDYRQKGRGTVVALTAKGAFVDYGGKVDAFAPANEFGDAQVNKGDSVLFEVIDDRDENGVLTVSLKHGAHWTDLIKAQKDGSVLSVTVVKVMREGSKIKGVRVRYSERVFGFVPFPLLSVRADKIDELVKQQIEVKVEKVNPEADQLYFNRKVLQDAQRQSRDAVLDRVKRGDVFDQVPVVAIACKDGNEFGVFVEVEPGVRGLVYRSEIPGARKGSLSKRFAIGDRIDVMVLGVNEIHKGSEKRPYRVLSLSAKELHMQRFAESCKVGEIFTGVVESQVDYGVFISLPAGVDGLLHRNEYGEKGQPALDSTVTVRLISIDQKRNQIGLSMRNLPGTTGTSKPSSYEL